MADGRRANLPDQYLISRAVVVHEGWLVGHQSLPSFLFNLDDHDNKLTLMFQSFLGTLSIGVNLSSRTKVTLCRNLLRVSISSVFSLIRVLFMGQAKLETLP